MSSYFDASSFRSVKDMLPLLVRLHLVHSKSVAVGCFAPDEGLVSYGAS